MPILFVQVQPLHLDPAEWQLCAEISAGYAGDTVVWVVVTFWIHLDDAGAGDEPVRRT